MDIADGPGSEQTATGGEPRRRWRRWLIGAVVAALLLVAAFYLGGGYYFSGLIYDELFEVSASGEPETHEVVAVAAQGDGTGSVTLRMGPDAATRADTTALTGLAWSDSYAQAGVATEVDGDLVTRPYTMVLGVPPRVGDEVELDGWFFPEDPELGLGLPFQNVTYESELATFPAWYVPGTEGETTWAVFVHGRGAEPRESLRSMQIVAEHGLPMLAITYRNDEGQARSPEHRYGYGANESDDLTGAVAYAVDQGATKIVLFGFSMGGAIVLDFLYDDPLATYVAGAVLDAPASNAGRIVDERAEERTLPVVGLPIPESLESVALWITELRYDVSFAEINYVRRVEELPLPILVLQGTGDGTIPEVVNAEFAEADPEQISYETFEGAEHVRAWNAERVRYGALVNDYLADLSL